MTADVNAKAKDRVLQVLDSHRLMSLATNRPDGWPQATLVGYVNDTFLLYCFVATHSQKRANIVRDPRVSVAIGNDAPHPMGVSGLSLAGRAWVVDDRKEMAWVSRLRLKRYPEYGQFRDGPAAARVAPEPSQGAVTLLRIEPEIFSLIDYSKSFGHSELITFSERDLDRHLATQMHRWDGQAL
ncbi:MAG: pyridoxamine 5'-phosphate oxidase family protein [Reyranellaceae bacterium]